MSPVKVVRNLVLILAVLAVIALGAVLAIESRFRPEEEEKIEVPPGEGFLTGTISQPQGRVPFSLPGIHDATVTLTPGDRKAMTDEKGRFVISSVTPGVYTATIEADGSETTAVRGVAVASGAVTRLDEAIFVVPQGPPEARLKLGRIVPFRKAPAAYPYNTTVYIDAGESKNLSREGINWEIRDASGEILMDPYSEPPAPLQLSRSPIPGMPPSTFLFTPPEPDLFTVKLTLRNDYAPGTEDSASVEVRAINTPPQAVPMVVPGPLPPQKVSRQPLRTSSGLKVVKKGDTVFLKGYALDKNFSSPELYNPGGCYADIYGKNHDHLQRQFGWKWKLKYLAQVVEGEEEKGVDLTGELLDASGKPGPDSQYHHFMAQREGIYRAALVVNDRDPSGPAESRPASITIRSVGEEEVSGIEACANCHEKEVEGYRTTRHYGAEVGCESCHGPANLHLSATGNEEKRATQDVSRESGLCGQCHDQYNEWEKSRHSDSLPYGYEEIAKPLLVTCTKCHYSRSFSHTVELAEAERIAFHDVEYKKRLFSVGPYMADLSKLPRRDETAISCVACHDPHYQSHRKPFGLRTEWKGELCRTCHYEKWQNTILEGFAGEVQNGYEYPDENYELLNPHDTKFKCILCHLDTGTPATDAYGVRAVGGHTLRMRDAGPNGSLGGFGPRPDDPDGEKDPGDPDDILNLSACRYCHKGLTTFNRNGLQKAVYDKWKELGALLESLNGGTLPGFRPGDKCATCHKGGTVPFQDDPKLVLEDAHTNYKLVKNDRSWGIHNPPYVVKLLEDSIRSVKGHYPEGAGEGAESAGGHNQQTR
jgi:predicted CXXCH cytochrome family protein